MTTSYEKNSTVDSKESRGPIKITKYAKLLISKKEIGHVYYGHPISRKSCGSKARYELCGMAKPTSKSKKSGKMRGKKLNSEARIQAAVMGNERLNSYYEKHSVFSKRTSGEGAKVIYNR